MSGIPKVFHQIWLGGREIPRQFLEYQETWRRHHRGWGLELWNEARLPELRLSKFLPLCNSLANRSNLLRVELLLLFGGVYLDTDFECMKSIEPLLEGVTCFAAYQLDDPLLEGAVNNAIIGAISGHPFLEDMVRHYETSFSAAFTANVLGPSQLTERVRGRSDVMLFPKRYFYPYLWTEKNRRGEVFPEAYGVHHWAGSWLGVQ
jgi:mannosyltransferase OCH1-like enzyme